MDFVQLIVKEGLVMIPVLYILGEIICTTKGIPNKWIPLILLFISMILTPLLLTGYSAQNIIQAILVAGVTVLGDQIIKQSQKRKWQN